MNTQKTKRIPYGVGDYKKLRLDNNYYVDKTHYIPLLEAAPYYVFFIRPRRFGKTLWLTLLTYYYDVNEADNFEVLFGDTYIGKNPTEARNSYLTITFNFSKVNPSSQFVHQSFNSYGKRVIGNFLRYYKQFFNEGELESILAQEKAEDQLDQLFVYVAEKNLKIYLFIDEYDNFANTILTTEGQQAYQDLTHGAGFFRYFFNVLKGATTGRMGGIDRLFITGVSPIAMDDVTSGFNIGTNLSLKPQFNTLMGFTQAEVIEILSYYQQQEILTLAVDYCLQIMKLWYNNYYFSDEAQEQLFNTDMVLYFIENIQNRTQLPRQLIDQNITTDYGKLRHLILVDQQMQAKETLNNNRQLNGNFSLLRQVIETGQVSSEIVSSFPLEQLQNRENFISLLYYLGLLTFNGTYRNRPRLTIPNLTIKHLMYGYLRAAYNDVDVFRLDLWRLANLISAMAYDGEWEAVFDFLNEEIKSQASVHDYLKGEKMIQGFLLAYLNFTNFYLTWSEREMSGGFVDIYLEPFIARYPDIKVGYLIELKYISTAKFNKETLNTTIANAEAQLKKYANDDRLKKVKEHTEIKQLVLVYKGWELVYKSD